MNIPGEITGWRDFVGRRYRTARFGRVTFRDRDYEKAGSIQTPWFNDFLHNVYPDLPEVGHPLTLGCLAQAWQAMCNRVIAYAVKTGQDYKLGKIHTTGLYRPPGETWGEGRFADPHGVIDSTDNFGHWLMAVDISIERTRKSFTPHLAAGSVLKCLLDAGLVRPFASESWHFRPKRSYRKRFERECPSYVVD